MKLPFAILLFMFLLFTVFRKKYKLQLVLIIISLMGNMFFFDVFGTRVLLFHMLALIAVPFYIFDNFNLLNKYIKSIKVEYITLLILGIFFGYILPWEDNSNIRSWSQLAGGRAIVALIRIFIELLLIYYAYKIFKQQKVTQKYLLGIISKTIIFLTLFSLFDFAINHEIWKLIFTESAYLPILDNRFLGWSHEPRSFGRLILIPWFILLIYVQNGYYIRHSKIALFLGFISIVSSLSFSTYFIFFVGMIILFLLRFKLKTFNKAFTSLIASAVFIFLAYYSINKTDYFKSGLVYRYQLVTQGKGDFQMKGEPYIFTSFEVFDRAALNFFYNNLNYIFLGTGPNLISIPSSKYLDKSASETFNGTLIGIPGIGLINHISRAGLIGLVLYLSSFIKINSLIKKSKNKALKEVFTVITLIYLFVGNPWIYFIIGFVVAQSELLIILKRKAT